MPFPLEAALQLVGAVSRHGRDDRLRLAEGGLEGRRFAGFHLELRALEDHFAGTRRSVIAMVTCAT